jgi:hypothetical protein
MPTHTQSCDISRRPVCHLRNLLRPLLDRHTRGRLGGLPAVGLEHGGPLLRAGERRQLRRVAAPAVAAAVGHLNQLRLRRRHAAALAALVREVRTRELEVARAHAVAGLAVDLDRAVVTLDGGAIEGIAERYNPLERG